MGIDVILPVVWAALAIGALWRTWGSDAVLIAAALCGALIFGVTAGAALPAARLIGMLALIEAGLAMAMLIIVTNCAAKDKGWCITARRAQSVGIIGIFKIGACLIFAGTGGFAIPWVWYAVAINAGFVFQVAITGGYFDGLGSFVHRVVRRVGRGNLGTSAHR